MIVGEALRQALERDPGLRESISETRRIISFRNRLVHGYSLTDHEIVWGVLGKDVPVLHLGSGGDPQRGTRRHHAHLRPWGG